MITKDIIIDFFKNLKLKGDFNIKEKLLWGYFFLDKDINKLKKLSKKLEQNNYTFVDIFEAEKEEAEDPQEYYLHVEKIEHHNVETLDKRNKELYLLAEKNNIEYYDGFDVGNVTD
ncbi:ribonuclease E inhibitor RraB [Tenacibaculum ascidiaceicola]|uniref:ribonuclease E inhibitor RraB n=1 Tax=Tenacibaculum ascidiaceicola TaxID=1699411 RepID=UPI0038962E7A